MTTHAIKPTIHPPTRALALGLAATLIVTACKPSATPTAPPNAPTLAAPVASPTAVPVSQPTAAPTAAPAATAIVLSEDGVMEAVHKAWAALGAAGPRKVVQTNSDSDGPGTVIEAVFVPPDSLHQIVKMGGRAIAEQYSIGDTIYNNTPQTGGWVSTQVSGGTPGVMAMFGDSDALSDAITYSNAHVEGNESVNGHEAVIYAYSSQLKGADKTIQHRLWVDTTSGLPVKNEIVSDQGTTTQEITVDASLTIDLPADVAAAPPAP